MAEQEAIAIEVVYALARSQTLIRLNVPKGTTVAQALARCGIASLHPEIDVDAIDVGIYGRSVSPMTILEEGDRVELYRPLIVDAGQARRRRALKKRTR